MWIWAGLLAALCLGVFGVASAINWAGDWLIERLRVHYGQPEDDE
jgi:hypothetical protein